ncbi:hypothetical protein C8R41DRAFT_919725 [Lentinula lateritia]|uniref:Fungal-type protein kinase domain-containing protein n=1 Tax=Lentinula lateritia TaxID=40482 RepID=A0ABQ8VG66_9AGAR|nr:hypothetical protein C8R41DRAFT_919725 [Lentinula lateritia]
MPISIPDRAVKKRTQFFYEHSTDFPLHRLGLLYNTDGGIDSVPVPVVTQNNDPVRTAAEYVYAEFWIRPAFNVLSTDRAIFDRTSQHTFHCLDGRGIQSSFTVFTESQEIPSTQERRRNTAIQQLLHAGHALRGHVLVVKHCSHGRLLLDVGAWDRLISNDILRQMYDLSTYTPENLPLPPDAGVLC